MRALARVMKAAIGVVLAYWQTQQLSSSHPYRQAALMISRYLEHHYHV